MTLKTTGVELKAFYADPAFWPETCWHDELLLEVDGKQVEEDFCIDTDLRDDSQVKILSGFIDSEDGSINCTFESHMRKWRKAQDAVFLSVVVSKDRADAVIAAIQSAGGKVRK